jgi:hypothetical protein
MRTRNALAAAVCLLAPNSLASDCTRTSTGLIPLSDLGTGFYLGQFQGGLYEGGSNQMPAGHFNAGMDRLQSVRPRDALGNPSPSGRVVLMSLGMSNTTQEWCSQNTPAPCDSWSFSGQAAASPLVDQSTLAIVNGAAGGQDAPDWDSPTDPNYDRVRDTILSPRGLTEGQVQIIWIKQANAHPLASLPAANADAYALVTQLGNIVRAAKTRYPNLQMVFLSSRIYAGYATSQLNPEPYAYESGFACKWVIQAQERQNRGLGIDPRAGNLSYDTAPWIVWGPYLWADGLAQRSDGLTWQCSDFRSTDGTHPETPGRTKVGSMLLNFFLSSPHSAPWFRADHARYCNADVNGDGDTGTDADIEAFFACLAGSCCGACTLDFNGDGDIGTDADIEGFFRVLAGGAC